MTVSFSSTGWLTLVNLHVSGAGYITSLDLLPDA